MTTVQRTIRINASKQQVWDVIADLGGIQDWHPGVTRSYYHTDARFGAGAGRVCELAPMGKVQENALTWATGDSYTLEILPVEKVPPFRNATATLQLTAEGAAATFFTITLVYQMGMGPIGSLMNGLMVRSQFTKGIEGLAKGLKHYIETGEVVAVPAVLKNTTYQFSSLPVAQGDATAA